MCCVQERDTGMLLRLATLLEEVLGMRKTALPLAAMVAALLVSVLALATTEDPARAAFPGVNGKIAFLSNRDGQNEIYTISFAGSNPTRLTHSDKSDKTPSFSPNGKKIVWERGEYLYLMNADGSNQHKIPHTHHSNYEIGRYGSYGGNPAFSPDGRKIVFDKGKNIWTINPDGTGLTRITNVTVDGTCQEKPTLVHPVWSPVSNKIAFSWVCGEVRELHVMALSDQQNKQTLDSTSRLSPEGVRVYRPDWSPDGSRIVYEYCAYPCKPGGGAQDYNPNIYKVDVGTGVNTPIVTGPYNDSYPVFSPGVGKIVYSSDRDGDEDLYIKNADGTGTPQRLTKNTTRDVEPDWQPVR